MVKGNAMVKVNSKFVSIMEVNDVIIYFDYAGIVILFVWVVMWVYLQDICCGSLVGFVLKSVVICLRFASC